MSSRTHPYAVVLAGGGGQRFWPLSRELSPKQLLTMFGQESLIAQAVRRILPFTGDGSRVMVVTNERLFDELRNHMIAQPDERLQTVRYLQEPLARNTAPAIALAAAVLEAEDPGAVMVVLPSDHLLEDGQLWADCMNAAVGAAAAGYLVTIGITPTRAETGYGYIRAGAALPEFASGEAIPRVAAQFTEKPDRVRAESFVADGQYYWNAGIFAMRAGSVLDELVAAGGDAAKIADVCRWFAAQSPEAQRGDEARERFASLSSLSIDYAVMERSQRVVVIPAALRWDDVGSLLSLERLAEPDACGTVRVGRGVDIDSRDSIVYSTDRLVATLGLQGMVVVDTADATLVLPKERVQDVRLVVEALKALGTPEVSQTKVSLRPWGSWTSLLRGDGFHIKLIEVTPGARLSLQRHDRRSEHWIVLEGTATVVRGDELIEVATNESVFIQVGARHRLANNTQQPLRLIEVQVGEYVGEDDIVRMEDDWARDA